MVLSESIASQVVEQLSTVIDQHINIMDVTGTIVGSTDKGRIGTIHGGAKKILNDNLKDLLIESNEEYEGSKSGINLPVLFDGEIVGVIGITGQGDEVKKYGEIIKKMTEILLRDSYAQEQRTIEQKARDRFFDEWIFNAFDVKSPEEFRRRAALLDVHPERIRRIAILNITGDALEPLSDVTLTDISRDLRRVLFEARRAEMFRTATKFVILFGEKSDGEIVDILRDVIRSIKAKHVCSVTAGIDSGSVAQHISGQFEQAERALNASHGKNTDITVYDELDPVQFAGSISNKDKRRFIEKLFGSIKPSEIDEWLSFLRVFYEADGSINTTAEKLNMHKNTVQYKLNKLASATGHDPRSYSSSFLFQFAIELSEYTRTEE